MDGVDSELNRQLFMVCSIVMFHLSSSCNNFNALSIPAQHLVHRNIHWTNALLSENRSLFNIYTLYLYLYNIYFLNKKMVHVDLRPFAK